MLDRNHFTFLCVCVKEITNKLEEKTEVSTEEISEISVEV